MPEKEILLALLGTALNMPEKDAVASLYNEDGSLKDESEVTKTLLAKDAERISTIKTAAQNEKQGAFDNGYKKAQGEVASTYEKSLKEKFGLKTDKTLQNGLIDEIVAVKMPEVKGMNEDAIKASPFFLSYEKQVQEKVQQMESSYQEKIKAMQGEFEQNQILTTVTQEATKVLLEKIKPKLPENEVVKNNYMKVFHESFRNYNYTIVPDQATGHNIIVPLQKDGKRLEDAHGNPIPFESLAQQTASQYFEIPKQDSRSTGANPTGEQGGRKTTFDKPKSEEEYMAKVQSINNDASLTPQQRVENIQELQRIYRGKT